MGTLQQGLAEAWAAIATFVPKLVVFGVVVLVGWGIAKAVARTVQILLAQLSFDRLMARSGLAGYAAKSGVDVPGLLVKVVQFFVVLVFVQLGLGVFGPNPVSDLIDQVVLYLPKIAVAIVLVLVSAALGRAVGALVRSGFGTRPIGPALARAASGFVVGIGAIAALDQLGIARAVTIPVLVAALATVGGVVVVGVGGGLVKPMQQRWSRWLDSAESQFSRNGAKHNGRGDPEDVRANGHA